MSVLQIYLNWANTLLQEVGVVVEGITCLQEGKVICQLIDLLQHESDLLKKAQESESQSAENYIQTAISHMKRHGIRVRFTAQDILDGDVKSMLDVLWLIILNYGIHSIGRSAVERSVGVGKKLLLDWCQKELSADFDPRNTLSYNLCTGDWLLKLLKLYTDVKILPEERSDQYRTILQATEEQLGIKQNILNPVDIVEGTVDEHTLMIYVSLLKRKVGGEEQLDISEDSLDRVSPKPPIASPASPSLERKRSSPSRLHSSVEADDNSDWFSSSNGSIKSGSGDPPVSQEGESLLIQTITERVSQHIQVVHDNDDDEESNVSVLSGSISQTSVPCKREVIDIDLPLQPQEKNLSELSQVKEEVQTKSEANDDSSLVTTQEELESKQVVLKTISKDEKLNFDEKCETDVNENKTDTEATVLKHTLEREPLHTVSLTVNRSREFGSSVDETKQKQDLENRKKAFQEEMEREARQRKEEHERGGSSESLEPEGDRSGESMEEIFTEGTRGPQNFFPGFGRGMPIFVMPGQSSSPEMMLLLQALRQARHEANYHDKEGNGDTEETVPKLHTLLNLDDIDDQTPSVTPQMSQRSHSSQNGHDTPVSDSEKTTRKKQPSPTVPERNEPFVHFQNGFSNENDAESDKQGKRGILEVVSETIEPRLEYYDLSKTNISENEKRRFPRVNITEPLKERIKKAAESPRERSKDRKSPERSSGYRSRSLTPGSGYEEEQTMPKSILKDRSKTPLDSISPERRERLLCQTDDPGEPSPRSSFERSPRSSYEKSPRSSKERSPRSSRDRALDRDLTHSPRSSIERSPRSSTDRLSGRDWSPRSPRLSPDRITSKERSSSADLSPRLPRTPRSPRAKSPATDDGLEDETSPGRSSRETDPNRRLVRVLNRELELLKLKMDVLEKSNTTDDAELEDIDKVTKRLSEKVQERLGRSPDRSPTRRQSSRSPEYSRGRLFRRKLEDDTSSSIRSRSDTRVRSSVNFDQPTVSSNHMSRSLQDLSISEASDGKLSFAPSRKGKPISLGYSSPIRKVSEEIWGMNSADNVGYDPEKIAKWKKLVRKPHVSDEDVIEIKQALATAITENDILQAKLKNANSEIEEKMSKTNDVLNDCRTHLAKSQAENMELRTQLEKEKTRNDSIEARIRELDKQLATSKSQNDELERQLENMTTLLQGASKKDVPTIQSMAEERDNYKGVLANTQRENTQLKEDLIREKKLTSKQQNMINDLKNILDDARKERNQMFAEISRLQKQGQLTKVTGIISRYIDDGLYDDTDGEEEEPINGLQKSNHGSKANSFYLAPNESYTVPRARVEQPAAPKVTSTPYRSRSESLGQSRRMFDDSYNTPSRMTPSRSASLNISGIEPMSPSPVSSNQRTPSYDFEKASQSATIVGHEIYPHRRSNSFRNNFTPSFDMNDDDNMDDLEVQKYLSKQPAGKLDFENDDDYHQQVPRKEFQRTKSPNVSKSPMGRGLSFSDLSTENKTKKQLLYSPYLMNKGPNGLTSRSYLNHSPYENTKETVDCIIESPVDNRYKDDYQKFSSQRVEYGAPSPDNDKSFLKALEHAVQQESNSIQKIYDELNLDYVPTRESRNTTSYGSTLTRGRKKSKSPSPSRIAPGLKGILKNTKSETNLNIKEGRTTPVHRSTYSHSASPARTPTKELNSFGSRFGSTDLSSGKGGSSVGKSTYTTPIKRSASLRTPRDMFDDSLGTKPSSLRYKHQPLVSNRISQLENVYGGDGNIDLECEICRAHYEKICHKRIGPWIQHKITELQNDVCRYCQMTCQF